MSYYSSGGLAIFGIIFIIILMVANLIIDKKWFRFLLILISLALYPLVFWGTSLIDSNHLRLWVGMLVVCSAPFWLLSVLYIGGSEGKPKINLIGSKSIRIRGALAFVVGILAWAYGAISPALTNGVEALTAAVALYGIFLGAYWFFSGKNLVGENA